MAHRNSVLLAFAVTVGLAGGSTEANAENVAAWSVPALREWQAEPGFFMLSAKSRIVVSKRDNIGLRTEAEMLQHDIREISGERLPLIIGKPRPGDILLSLGPEVPEKEGYRIAVHDQIDILASTATGVFYGGQTLLQLLKHTVDRHTVPRGAATDYPLIAMRSVMIDTGRHYYQVDQIDELLRDMAWKKLNTLHLHFTDWPAFRLDSDKFPGLAPAGASYNRKDIGHILETARRNHILVVPEVDFPAHSTALIKYRPALAFACDSMQRSEWMDTADVDPATKGWTVDITKDANRRFLRDVLTEFIAWFDGPYFHVGGDEYEYDEKKARCPEIVQTAKDKGYVYAGDLFVDFINEMDGVVKASGKKTVIWNWWRFKDDKTSIEPEKDIIIEVWNSPRQKEILESGYEVIISPEDILYVTPGIIPSKENDFYGHVDIRKVYEDMAFTKDASIRGYELGIWSDSAGNQTDQFFFGAAYQPIAVVADKTWGGVASPNADAFLKRLNLVGNPPSAEFRPYQR